MDARSGAGAVDIELVDQVLDLLHLERTGQHDERIGALVGHDLECARRRLRRRGHHSDTGTAITRRAAPASPFTHNLLDLGRQVVGVGELQRDDHHRLLDALGVQAADDRQQALHVPGVVSDNQGVGLGECRDQAVARNHRLNHIDQRRCVDVAQLDHPGDVRVGALLFGGRLRLRQGRRTTHIARGHNLDHRSRPDRGETLELQD
jgi:hypothetical protein